MDVTLAGRVGGFARDKAATALKATRARKRGGKVITQPIDQWKEPQGESSIAAISDVPSMAARRQPATDAPSPDGMVGAP